MATTMTIMVKTNQVHNLHLQDLESFFVDFSAVALMLLKKTESIFLKN